jgi:hypothetical protein
LNSGVQNFLMIGPPRAGKTMRPLCLSGTLAMGKGVSGPAVKPRRFVPKPAFGQGMPDKPSEQ